MFLLWFALLVFLAELGAGRPKSCHSSSAGAVEVLWGGTTSAVGVSWRWKKWKQLVFSKNRDIYMSCFLTCLRMNYDTSWTYERLTFNKGSKLVLWTQSGFPERDAGQVLLTIGDVFDFLVRNPVITSHWWQGSKGKGWNRGSTLLHLSIQLTTSSKSCQFVDLPKNQDVEDYTK
jgi:hypothetical protein